MMEQSRRWFVLAAALGVGVQPGSAAVQQLFNGRNLEGWAFLANHEGPGFVVEDGELRTQGGSGLLWYTSQKIGNSIIRVVYRMSNANGNSGVFIRVPTEPVSEPGAANAGIEVQIDDRDNDWHCTGTLYSMTKAMARASRAPGEWNVMEITLDGARTIVTVNGAKVTDYDGVSPVPEKVKPYEPDRHPRAASGYIGLQNHDSNAVISFKEISVRPLR
ncbi:MAG: DUF1080 domain-containing protein [Bryobacteraceae bacterium]